MDRHAAVSALAAILVFASLAGTARAEDPTIPADTSPPATNLTPAESERLLDETLAGWAKRRKRFESVEYVLRGEMRHAMRDAARPGRKEGATVPEHAGPVDSHLWLDFASRRVRSERSLEVLTTGSAGSAYLPDFRVGLRDRDRLIVHIPRDRQPAQAPRRAEFDYDLGGGRLFAGDLSPLLQAHGYLAYDAYALGDFAAVADRKDFEVVGLDVWQGRECVVLRRPWPNIPLSDEFWIDLGRDAAVVRSIQTVEGRKTGETSADYVSQEGVWMPAEWRCTYWNASGAAAESVTHRVVKRNPKPDLTRVVFWAEPKQGDHFLKDSEEWRHEGPDKPPTNTLEEFKRKRQERRNPPKDA